MACLTSVARRTVLPLVFAVIIALGMAGLEAQQATPGRNVNVNGGPTWVLTNPFEIVGDPWRNQTVEPECDVSSRNHGLIVCSGVGYQMVDLPGGFLNTSAPPNPHPDSWNMIAQSRDGGLTWMSRPHPGHSLDTSGTAPLLKKYGFGADPIARFGAAGVMLHVGLAANRGDNAASAIYSSTWIHLNNHEYDPEPVKFTGIVREITTGSSGQFRDRPHLALGDVTDKICTFSVPVYDAASKTTTTVPQAVPCTQAYVAYATFVGDRKTGPRSKIYFARSANMGKSWDAPIFVSEQNAINQGVQIVKVPGTKKILLFWRRGAAMDGQTDTIMFTVSQDNGSSWAKAQVFADVCPFDQDNTPTRFRVRTMATAAAGPGRAYVVWAERTKTAGVCNPLDGQARVMIATTDGVAKTAPVLVDASTAPGHQIFPTLAVAAGKIHVSWMDFRDDASRIFQPLIDEEKAVRNQLTGSEQRTRHTADMRAAEASAPTSATDPVVNPVFGSSFQVSEYIVADVDGTGELRQVQWNVGLARNFNKMQIPFDGDYNASRGESIVPVDPVERPGVWDYNFGKTGDPPRTPVFHDFWTDGRNMRLLPGGETLTHCADGTTFSCELFGNPIGSIPRPYKAPSFPPSTGIITGGTSFYDPTAARPACDPANPGLSGTKNLDIYTSRTTRGLYAYAPWNTSPQPVVSTTGTAYAA
jgi:hypothetical protein